MIALLAVLALAEEPAAIDHTAGPTPDAPIRYEFPEVPDVQGVLGPDRSGRPEVLPPVPMDLPDWEAHEIRPGLEARLVHVEGVRKVAVALVLHRGSIDLDGPSVAARNAGWLVDVATESRDAEALEIWEDINDVAPSSEVFGYRRWRLGVDAPKEKLPDALSLLGEIVRTPAYPRRDVAREVRDTLYWLEVDGPASLGGVTDSAAWFAWFPADSLYGTRTTTREWRRLRRPQLVDQHARLLASAPATVVIVGDVTWAEVEPLLASALEGVGKPGAESELPRFQPATATRVVAIDLDGAEQARVSLALAAPLERSADELPFEAVSWALGGHFMSRLNRNLREEKGFTYGAGGSYSANEQWARYTAGVEVKAENTGAAIREIEAEIAKLAAEGATAEEIAGSYRETVLSWNTLLQTAPNALPFYRDLMEDHRTTADARAELDGYGAVTPEQTRDVAARWLGPDRPRQWVVTGDRDVVGPQLEALGWTVEWVTPQQAILGEL